jgi:hypothetical protein
MVIRKESCFRDAYRNLYCMVSSTSETGGSTERKVVFTKVWLDDPLIRTFLKMDFVPPPLECTPRTYNMWQGFAVDSEVVSETDDGDAAPFLAHMSLLTNHHEAST